MVSFITTAERFLKFSDEVVKAVKEGRRLTNDEFRRLYGQIQFDFQFTEADEEDEPSVYLKELKEKDTGEYDVKKIELDVAADHNLLEPVIEKAKSIVGKNDGKIARLKQVLPRLLPEQKVLIFTFYADTAEYIYQELTSDEAFLSSIGKVRIEKIVGGTRPAEKNRIVAEFAPKANNSVPPARPIQVLIATDVLSEGQNLQDCGYLINYDLHFNPVRLIQRNGRIDRLFSDFKEITIANFFPEGGLEEELRIVERLQRKIEQIQENLPVDSSVIGETVRVFSLEELRRTRAGDITVLDEIDARNPINRFHEILNEVIKMIQEFGIEEINKIPFGCQSNKKSTHRGVFLCVSAGKREDHKYCWWLYYKLGEDGQGRLFPELSEPIQDPSQIIDLIRSARPISEEMSRPDVSPREIRWDIILDAKRRCREMLVTQFRNETQGQIWPANHTNKKIQKFFAAWPQALPDDIAKRLGRFSLEKHKTEAEELLKSACEKRDATGLIKWLDEKLPRIENIPADNPETIPLEIVSYLELIPETEG